jgi:hypothetical protein
MINAYETDQRQVSEFPGISQLIRLADYLRGTALP